MALNEPRAKLYDSDRFLSWSRLRAELFQSELLAPSDIAAADVKFTRRMTVYRVMLVLMIVALGAVMAEALYVGKGPNGLMLLAGLTEVALLATLVRLIQVQRVLLPPVFALMLTICLVLWSVADGAAHQSLWLFPLMIAMAGLLPTEAALVLGILTLAGLGTVHGRDADIAGLAEDVALAATWVIALTMMRMMTRQSDELADLALSDPLTGAYNRRYLTPQANRNLADFQRYARLSSMLMIDIDHFKEVNDRFGHAQGDLVLQGIVRMIDERIRGVDMLFRLGGEEFVVLLSEVGNQTAVRIAEELRLGISHLELLPGRSVTVSIGVCDVTRVDSAEDWLVRVDEAMYQAKEQGRNQVCAVESSNNASSRITSSLPIWR